MTVAQSIIGYGRDGGRPKDDFYPTPPEATKALLAVEKFGPHIWEPACGDGAISKVLEKAGYSVESSDLNDHGYGDRGVDFLLEHQSFDGDIITNPPFKLGQQFAEHALHLGVMKMALLLKINFLEGVSRCQWLEKSPLVRVLVFRKRLTLLRSGMKRKGGVMITFAWYIWKRRHEGKPTIGWI